MQKRFIRLKEFKPNLNKIYMPSDEYLVSRKNLRKNELYTLRTDSEGNQRSSWGKTADKKIYLLGDSSVESIYIKPTLKPHSALEKMVLENGFDYSVYNLGVSGAQTLNIVNLIINKLGNKKGSIVVVSIPSNDASTLNLKDNYYSDDWRYASIVPADNKEPLLVETVDYYPFKKNIEMIIELCKILQLQLHISSIIYTGKNERYEKLNKITSEICLYKNIPFINFELDLKKMGDLFYDPLHFLSSGSYYYAERIFNAIQHTLIPSNSALITIHNICSNTILTKTMVWSDYIKVSNNNVVTVIVEAEFPMNTESKQALLSVDYGKDSIESELRKSKNSEIGYFEYLSAPTHKRIELLIDLKVPDGCDEIRIGLRGWKSTQVKVIEAVISVLNS